MIRLLGAVLVAGLLLSACGSVSAASAMRKWEQQSGYVANNKNLLHVARSAATALANPKMTALDLHTVCAVLYDESNQANSALLTPDAQTSALLGKAYGNLGAAANLCYDASTNVAKRDRALVYLSKGVGQLAEASARVASLTGA